MAYMQETIGHSLPWLLSQLYGILRFLKHIFIANYYYIYTNK